MKSLYGDGLEPAAPVVANSFGASGSAVRRYAAAPPPPTFHSVPVESSSVSCETLKLSLMDAADSNLPSDFGAVGSVRSTTSTWSPPSSHACVQSGFTKLAMCPDPRPAPVSPSGRTEITVGDVGSTMLTTYMIEPRSLASRSFTTIRTSPQRSTSSFSKCGSGSSPTIWGAAGVAMSSTVTPLQPLTKA